MMRARERTMGHGARPSMILARTATCSIMNRQSNTDELYNENVHVTTKTLSQNASGDPLKKINKKLVGGVRNPESQTVPIPLPAPPFKSSVNTPSPQNPGYGPDEGKPQVVRKWVTGFKIGIAVKLTILAQPVFELFTFTHSA